MKKLLFFALLTLMFCKVQSQWILVDTYYSLLANNTTKPVKILSTKMQDGTYRIYLTTTHYECAYYLSPGNTSWTRIFKNIIPSNPDHLITCIATNQNNVYIGTIKDSLWYNLHSAVFGNGNWKKISGKNEITNLWSNDNSLLICAAVSSSMKMVYESVDGGKTLYGRFYNTNAIPFVTSIRNKDSIYASAGNQLYKAICKASHPEFPSITGNNWSFLKNINDIEFVRNKIIVATDTGIYINHNGYNGSFSSITSTKNVRIKALHRKDNLLLAIGNDANNQFYIFYSKDLGFTWQNSSEGIYIHNTYPSIMADITTDNTSIYVALSNRGFEKGCIIQKRPISEFIPVITINPETIDFGNQEVNTTSIPVSYSINVTNVTANLTVAAPNGFLISKTANGTYTNSLSFTPSNGSINTTVYVVFKPTQIKKYETYIAHNSNAVLIDLNLTGEGTGILYSLNWAVESGSGTLSAKVDGVAITSPYNVQAGKNIDFTATPSAGFKVGLWMVNSMSVPNNTQNTFTLSNITANTMVFVRFVLNNAINEAYNNTIQCKISPNPANEFLQIDLEENTGITVFQILNCKGEMIINGSFQEKYNLLSINSLGQGLYFIKIETTKGFTYKKFIKL